MLAFFRKIRKSIIESGSARKYLLYAIGEILLVVIGILIALQVNNWNTEKAGEKELNGYLLTIAGNIRSDLPVIQSLKDQRDSVRDFARRFAQRANKDHFEAKEAGLLTLGIIMSFEVRNFNCNQGGFESLKASGLLGKIQGSPLAESLFEYYRGAGVINNLSDIANTYSQAMQIELMKQEFAPRWGSINGYLWAYQSGKAAWDDEYWEASQATLQQVFHHPATFAMIARHGSDSELRDRYEEIHQLGSRIIQDIENRLK